MDASYRPGFFSRLRAWLGPPGGPHHNSIGGYRLEGLIDSGTTVVYRGRRLSGGPEVAIKVLALNDPRSTQHFVRRFLREVEILKRLAHPGIVAFVDAGLDGSRLFLVQELVHGGNLRTVLPPGGLEMDRFLRLFTPMCEAVAYAHAKGVVHRDIKPENVLVVDRERIKIADFGLARSKYLGTITTVATTLGTPVYMAPEQCTGHKVTAHADQYSLGAVAYEMLVGAPPFSGGPRIDVLTRHLYEDPIPPSQQTQLPIPPALDYILLRMLAKDPADRFGSLDDVLTALPTTV